MVLAGTGAVTTLVSRTSHNSANHTALIRPLGRFLASPEVLSSSKTTQPFLPLAGGLSFVAGFLSSARNRRATLRHQLTIKMYRLLFKFLIAEAQFVPVHVVRKRMS